MKTAYFKGPQNQVAQKIAVLLFGPNATKKAANCILDYIKIQRGISEMFDGRSSIVMWRGIGIETAPRKTACWIEDPQLLRVWRERCREDRP